VDIAASKEDVLTPAVITQILSANPQSAKSDEVLLSLDQRIVPMPDTLMNEILGGLFIIGEKEEMEMRLSHWKRLHGESYKRLIRHSVEDTSGVYGTDSLVALLKRDGSLNSTYDLVSLWFDQKQYDSVYSLLNQIPAVYSLSPQEEESHARFTSLYPILHQVDTSVAGINSLTSSQVATLTSMAGNDLDLPGAYARNLLIMKGSLAYEEPIIFPTANTKASLIRHSYNPSLTNHEKSFIRVFPNPAKNYFIVEYLMEKKEGGNGNSWLTLYDLNGRVILNHSARKGFDQLVVPTGDIPAGNYLLRLTRDGALLDKVKLTIMK